MSKSTEAFIVDVSIVVLAFDLATICPLKREAMGIKSHTFDKFAKMTIFEFWHSAGKKNEYKNEE